MNTTLVLSTGNGNALAVSDVDAGTLQVALSSTNGTLTLASTTGLSFGAGDGVNDAAMVFTGSVTAINNALNGLQFLPTSGYQGSATVSLTTSDLGASGSGGVLTDSDSVTIQVGAARFQQGVDGYSGTQDTWVSTGSSNTNHGAEATVVADDNSGSDAALLRFDNLFGGGRRADPVGCHHHRCHALHLRHRRRQPGHHRTAPHAVRLDRSLHLQQPAQRRAGRWQRGQQQRAAQL